MNQIAVYDTEILGSKWPVFLTCVVIPGLNQKLSFWHHSDDDRRDLEALFERSDLTFVSFNGNDFDYPMLCAAMAGWTELELKHLATEIIEGELRSWETMKQFAIPTLRFDHIDMQEVAPGVMVSLKRYMARMGYPTLIDMPFHHDKDLSQDELAVATKYCFNDCGGTLALFNSLSEQIDLRIRLSEEVGIDLRSKSDAQIAEAMLRKKLGIVKVPKRPLPRYVKYSTPPFIQTDNEHLQWLIDMMSNEVFLINQGNGSPEAPAWMDDDYLLGSGSYKVGIGGLHSTHDLKLYVEASEDILVSDFDVASYYPNIIMKAGLIPRLGGDRGDKFIEAYREVYEQRIAAKRSGNKADANSLKIVLNGTYGKLGNKYSAFYSPDLMLAVCLTGQLNLLCLIDELERIEGVKVQSANTDGIMVTYPKAARESVLEVFLTNAKRTGFEYEETPYIKVGMKDVNNYIAITQEREAALITPDGIELSKAKGGKVKGKGLYAEMGLMKNPTMQVCTSAAVQYLLDGTPPEKFIRAQTDMREFVAAREVQGGGVQYERMEVVDDWYEIADREWVRPGWTKKPVQRKSRPKPVEVGVGGVAFGRVARWYMSVLPQPPIAYLTSGNKVPKTDGGKLCMTLPDKIPVDLDWWWYINETREILKAIGAAK